MMNAQQIAYKKSYEELQSVIDTQQRVLFFLVLFFFTSVGGIALVVLINITGEVNTSMLLAWALPLPGLWLLIISYAWRSGSLPAAHVFAGVFALIIIGFYLGFYPDYQNGIMAGVALGLLLAMHLSGCRLQKHIQAKTLRGL